MKVFLSYNRADASVAETVADDVHRLGHEAWYDREVAGGQTWWNSILEQIRACDLFLFIMTVKSLESEACVAEYSYASELCKRVLPVLCQEDVRVNLLPPALSVIQFVNYCAQDKQAAFALVKALDSLPKPSKLPDPLPPEPPVPISYLGGLRMQIVSGQVLSLEEQSTLLVEIKQRLKDTESRQDALDLLQRLRGRKDLLASVAEEIDATLARWPVRGPHRSDSRNAPAEIVRTAEPTKPTTMRSGGRLVRWAVYGILALIAFAIAVELVSQQRPFVPVSFAPQGQTAQLWCCDLAGFKRCPMLVQGPLGSQCTCPFQGTGYICQ